MANEAKNNTSIVNPSEFPKYLMRIHQKDEKEVERKFLSFREACIVGNSGMVQVEFGRYVLNEDFSVRKMTEEDRQKISRSADEYGASK